MISNLLCGIIDLACELLTFAIIVDAILSWVPRGSDGVYKIRQVLMVILDPIMSPIRKIVSPLTYAIRIDISPIIAIFLLRLVSGILIRIVTVLL